MAGLCRTCGTKYAKDLHDLSSKSSKYSLETFSDLLTELIKPSAAVSQVVNKLPSQICMYCARRLVAAHKFVLQARSRERELLACLFHVPMDNDCLSEFLFDANVKRSLPVEMGSELNENCAQESCCSSESEGVQQNDAVVERDPLNTITSMADAVNKQEKGARLNMGYLDNEDYNSVSECKTLIAKTSQKLCKQKKETKVTKSTKREADLSLQKRAKQIDPNLCKANGYKLIQCMICTTQYSKIAELRQHLSEHPEFSFAERQNSSLDELAVLFNVDGENITADGLVTRIRSDLLVRKFDAYYSITNQSGYEMSLDSSETEAEAESDAEHNMDLESHATFSGLYKYTCELCNKHFKRKYHLYEHQATTHSWFEAQYVCTRCDAHFVSEQQLIHHYRTQCKNSAKRFTCRKCPLRFRWLHNLKEHHREHCIKDESISCPKCHRVFSKQKSLTVHLRLFHADQKSLLPCQWCNRKFYRRDYLIKHLKRHGLRERDLPRAEILKAAMCRPNGSKEIECKTCNAKFSRIADLRIHLLYKSEAASNCRDIRSPHNYSIINQSGFELLLSDSETNDDEAELKNRTAQRHPVATYVCEICQVACIRKYELMEHQWAMHRFVHLPQVCDVCVFKCVSKTVLDYHKKTQCHNVDKKHLCQECGFKFMWAVNLERHIQKFHTTLSTNNGPDQEKSAVVAKSMPCPHCDKVYVQKMRLNNHIRDVHTTNSGRRKRVESRFLCSFCGLEAQSAAALQIHIRRHTGEKPFKCDLCEMTFAHHYDMIGHRRKHTGEKPYHCTICGKDFSKSDKLKRHTLIHSGVKPYKCGLCEKSYRQAKDRALHMKKHTGDKECVCKTCGEKFLQSKTLEKHKIMRRHFDETK